MDTIHMLGFAGALVMLWFCAVLLSSGRSRELGKKLGGGLESHADGLDAYRNARAQARQKHKDKETATALRQKAIAAARAQFEGSIQ